MKIILIVMSVALVILIAVGYAAATSIYTSLMDGNPEATDVDKASYSIVSGVCFIAIVALGGYMVWQFIKEEDP